MLIHKMKLNKKEKVNLVDYRVIIKQLNEINDGKNEQKGKLDKN
jgi:hypothetical protein